MAKCFCVFERELIHVLFLTVIISVTSATHKRQVAPSFLDTGRRNITVPRGGLAKLRCKIRNLGPKEVAWRKLSMDYPLTVGTFVFEKDEHISVDHKAISDNIAEWNLIIKRAEPRHSGTYECQISATRVLTYHVHLHVLDFPAVESTNKDHIKRTGDKAGIHESGGAEVAGQSGKNVSGQVTASIIVNIVLFLIVILR
ncbi:uncharacterized protein LOC133182095 isoform X2 [Saccostrea echinata]|uniref:uncharacterized protein LOC133182095 isoform X2 n=1 Tax=Saccostrea echinata TaxID=191078 RepID=UPI002A80E0FA|nr:uncharacterized protein LOC133182095 isoform X2 [Saccostrea echinata]